MIRFECDYLEGAHPNIIKALVDTNFEQTAGYGNDYHCDNAKALIREACSAPDADIYFLVGGTQTNTTVISAALKPYQGVLSADSGHINVHETGAIESTGHKVLALPSSDGKLTAAQVDEYCKEHWGSSNYYHTVQPGLVYISQSTENGTIYTKAELTALREVCDKHCLPLFIDGARLGYAVMSEGSDLTLADIAALSDVFYIGGTKVGALFGEAVVITNEALKKDFRYYIKQRGALLAKGRLLGIQFETLFTDNLYLNISKDAIDLAMKVKAALAECGIPVFFESPSNQQFPVFTDAQLQKLQKKYTFDFWAPAGEGKSAVRICTSWATRPENVEELICDLKKL